MAQLNENIIITVLASNCDVCGNEYNHGLNNVRLGSWDLDLCFNCLKSEAESDYKSAAKLLGIEVPDNAQNHYSAVMAELNSMAQQEGPDVAIEPLESLVQEAVNRLKQIDPAYFEGVTKIVANQPSTGYGHVESGPEKDPSVIFINFPRIKQEVEQAMAGSSQEDINEAIINALVDTLAHEKGHVASFDIEQGFIGGESPAEQEQQRIEQRR